MSPRDPGTLASVGNLPWFHVGDNGQEDPIELQKKEELGEANLENRRSTGLSTASTEELRLRFSTG